MEKTEALALRMLPHSETSHIVTWLSPEFGRLTTLQKGAYRPKSPFLGQIEVGDTSELIFYARDRNGIHIARECSRLVRRDAVRRHWRRYVAAEYICRSLLQVCVPGGPHETAYRLAQDAIDFLCQFPVTPAFALQWELRLLKALGMAPQLETCMECAKKREPYALTDRAQRWLFSPSRGGILCASCAARPTTPFDNGPGKADLLAVPPDVLAVMRQWLNARSARSAQRVRCGVIQHQTLDRILSAFLDFHLDIDPKPRRKVQAMLSREPAALI